jgi:hypothetical protein
LLAGQQNSAVTKTSGSQDGVRQDSASYPAARQNGGTPIPIIEYPAAAPVPAAVAAVEVTQPLASQAEESAQPDQATIDRLSEALRNAGIDPAALNLTAHSDRVMYPGGDYLNRIIEVDTGGGHREYLGTDLVAKYPEIAVKDIQRALAAEG